MILELEHDDGWVPLPGLADAIDDGWRSRTAERVAARYGLDATRASALVDGALARRRETDELTLLALAGTEPTTLHVLVAHVDDAGDLSPLDLVGHAGERSLDPAIHRFESDHLDDALLASHLVRSGDGDEAFLVLGAVRGPWRVRIESDALSTAGLGSLQPSALTVLGTLRLVD